MRKVIMQNFFISCRMAVNDGGLINFSDYFDQYNKEYEITYEDIEEQFNIFIDDGGYDRKELETLMKKFIESAVEENYIIRTTKDSAFVTGILRMAFFYIIYVIATSLLLSAHYYFIALIFIVSAIILMAIAIRKMVEKEAETTECHDSRLRACRYAYMLISAYLELSPSDLSDTPKVQKQLHLPAVRP